MSLTTSEHFSEMKSPKVTKICRMKRPNHGKRLLLLESSLTTKKIETQRSRLRWKKPSIAKGRKLISKKLILRRNALGQRRRSKTSATSKLQTTLCGTK